MTIYDNLKDEQANNLLISLLLKRMLCLKIFHKGDREDERGFQTESIGRNVSKEAVRILVRATMVEIPLVAKMATMVQIPLVAIMAVV